VNFVFDNLNVPLERVESYMGAIVITKDTATPQLARMAAAAENPRAIMAAAAGAGKKFLVAHFRQLDRKHPNALGGKRSHFWNDVARSANITELTDVGAKVTVSDPRYAFKTTGGTITAKEKSFLAFPVRAECYGMAPRVFEQESGLKLVAMGHEDKGVLATVDSAHQVVVYYILAKSVDQKAQADALPNENEFRAAVMQSAEAAAKRQMNA
jgi:hypothetical protein